MGNRALRKQAAEALKEAGLSNKLYKGNKKAAFRALNARRLHRLIQSAKFMKEGAILHECDGFNMRVKEWEVFLGVVHPRPRLDPKAKDSQRELAVVVKEVEFVDEFGAIACGCSAPADPCPVEYMRQWWKGWITYHKANSDWAEGPYYDEMLRRIDVGEPICDKDGCQISELRELRYLSP